MTSFNSNAPISYKHWPQRPERIEADFVKQEFQKLLERVPMAEAAADAGPWIQLFADWNSLEAYITGEGSRTHWNVARDAFDKTSEANEKHFREQIAPPFEAGNLKMSEALIRSRHRDALGRHHTPYLIRRAEVALAPLADINSDLRVQESALVSEHDRQLALGKVQVQGQEMTLWNAKMLQASPDASERRAAFTAWRGWHSERRQELGARYDRLVKLRHQMGRNLGYENFIPLGYARMGRTDYGPSEAAAFRRAVKDHFVPLQSELFEREARALDSAGFHKAWDSEFYPAYSLPRGAAPLERQLDLAEQVFDRLSPRLADHFRRMRREQLIDLENRPGKQSGAFCTSFADEGRVAILCNSTNEAEDVRVLLHEMGHAFQGWESQAIEAVSLQWPTSDACEIHSMGMEYLASRHAEVFFAPEEAAKFERGRWREALGLMTYVCVVDEFQHWVYENPDCGLEARDRAWDRIWEIYRPGLDWQGIEELKSARWYAQGHIFGGPFYYIDYAIAETGAMQLALIDAKDSAQAVQVYLNLCRLGGTRSVVDIFRSAGLEAPFSGDVMKRLADHAARKLERSPTRL